MAMNTRQHVSRIVLPFVVALMSLSSAIAASLYPPQLFPLQPILYQPLVAFNPTSGIFAPGQQITLTSNSRANRIFFTIDGGFGQPATTASPYTGPISLIAGSYNRVTAYATNGGRAGVTASNTYEIPLFPSDELLPGGSAFLFGEAQASSCNYYQHIGVLNTASTSCTETTPVPLQNEPMYGYSSYTFKDWIEAYTFHDASGYPFEVGDSQDPSKPCNPAAVVTAPSGSSIVASPAGGIATCAMFVNVMDLNFTRDHHAAWNGKLNADSYSAAYVCNYLGPDFYHDAPQSNANPGSSPQVDQAIQNAQNRLNPGPCVALDYNGKTGLMRFLAFDPQTGLLLNTVDLDGRGQKTIPAACTACHGVPAQAAVANGSRQASNGGLYIPFDEANLRFSSQVGVRQQDEDLHIKALNQIVLRGQQSLPRGNEIQQLILGWYPLTSNPDDEQYYVPTAFQGINDIGAYNIYAQYCRSCHISNGVKWPYTVNGQTVAAFPVATAENLLHAFHDSGLCTPGPTNVMPNAKVTFDRLWTTQLGPAAGAFVPTSIQSYINASPQANLHLSTCAPPGYYEPFPNQRP
jgi:chitobiase/beta-hexosaminidase-like protein